MALEKQEAKRLWYQHYGGQVNRKAFRQFIQLNQWLLTILAFGAGFSAHFLYDYFKPASITPRADLILNQQQEKPSFSRENLFDEIIAQNILLPHVVMAQAELESSYFTQGISVKTNNLFGMRYPAQRPTRAIGIYLEGQDSIILGTQKELRKYLKKPTYAVYAHWTEAVKDYKLWQDYSFKTKDKYIEFLSRVYATEPTYAQKIAEISQFNERKK